ncbi:PD40 domain-containing protein, partial [bacterium]|nr:PD40 domain-containing protein [bacterium]
LVLYLVPAYSQTDVNLQIDRVGKGKVPIVLKKISVEMPELRTSSECISAILRNDLQLTGIFEPLFFEGNVDTLTGGRTAAAIFEGRLTRSAEGYLLDAKLLDYSSRGIIFRKEYTFQRDVCRSVAHHLSDEVTFFLVGETGIATTRILFLREKQGNKSVYIVDYDGHGVKRLTDDNLAVSPGWLDKNRFCYTSYKRGNPDCYIVDLKKGRKQLLSYRKGLNIAGGYYPKRDELLMTISVMGNSELFLIDSSGKIKRRLTRNRSIDCSATWAPNGREIAFVSDRTSVPQIYIMDRYGGGLRRLSMKGSYNTSPAWSPQGDLVSYVSRDGGYYRLKLVSPDGLWEETVYNDYLSYEDPSWAPNGCHLAVTVKYGGESWIVIVDIDSGEKRRLVRGESPAWSPTE